MQKYEHSMTIAVITGIWKASNQHSSLFTLSLTRKWDFLPRFQELFWILVNFSLKIKFTITFVFPTLLAKLQVIDREMRKLLKKKKSTAVWNGITGHHLSLDRHLGLVITEEFRQRDVSLDASVDEVYSVIVLLTLSNFQLSANSWAPVIL